MRAANKHQWIICFIILVLLSFPQIAKADRTVTSVALDGTVSGTVTVAPSATIGAQIFVTTDGQRWADNDWESTSWRIDSGPLHCIDHSDHTSSGRYSEFFNVTAPVTIGIYTAAFVAYNNDNCSSGASNTVTRQIEVKPAYPSVSAISLASTDPTSADMSVEWTVEFSEAVAGVDISDFVLVETGGTTDSSITGVSGRGTTWTVAVNTGTSDTGTLGLNLVDNDTIISASSVPLGGVGSGNGDYVGAVYTLVPPVPLLAKVASTSAATVGDTVAFTISVTNPDTEPLTDVVVTDVLPTGMTYVTHVVSVGSVDVSDQTVTWTISHLSGSSDVQLTIATSMSQQGIFTNTVISPGAISASATVLVLDSAVTHFRMDEPVNSWAGTAGEVVDSGGTALHGTWKSTSGISDPVAPNPAISDQHSTVIGDFCNAANFDGSSVVEVADSSLFDYTTQLSASTWIYPTAYPSELSSILSNDVNYEFHLNSSGNLYWWWQASTLTSAATIPLNQWTHVAITFDSSSGVRRQRIYVNGVPDSNTNNWQGTLSTNNCKVHIGGDVATGSCDVLSARNFQGMIDEVKLYGFEMTQAQVQADMNLGRNCSGTFDHIRIEHDGIGSICAPERVTIKACLNSDCTTLFPGNVTLNLSPAGWVDGNTFTFSGGITSRQLSWGTPGDISLGTSSISPIPAFSTQCYDGSTQTCTLNFADVSCAFDAVESGALPQTPIFTKLSGVSFDIDVLALLNSSTVNTNYTNTVELDLVDSTSSACPTGDGLTSASSISFTAGDAGRKTATFNYPNAARNVKVRVRVGDSAPACSNDNFAIRPHNLNISSSDADNHDIDGTPVIVAGEGFNLIASAIAGYDGIPSIDPALVTGTPTLGVLSGRFDAASAASGLVTGTFTYSEVGHFGLLRNAVYDDTFTFVDQPDECTPDFSNELSNGKYGCSFGSDAVPQTIGNSGFGRFIPASFNVGNNTPLFSSVCNSSFTYLGQPFGYFIEPELTVTALNRAGEVTLNYSGSYWKLSSALSGRQYSNNATTSSLLTITTPGSVSWSGTSDNDGTGTADISGEFLTYSKPTMPEGPFVADADLIFSAEDLTDGDGVCYDPDNDGICDTYSLLSILGGELRYGQLQLQNAYGSETLPLTIPVLTEYYDGVGFVPNSLDICTNYDFNNLILSNYQGNLLAGDSVASGSGTLLSGIGHNLLLSAPGAGHDGSVDLMLDLSQATGANMEWLQPGGSNPTAKATFGIFKGNPRMIYMRESIW
ncbi:DUF6701 domain-containing protein [uncultured Desulfuromusa sp.]|uniref:DUF6701 domain-containing protein n=1 Tax=uncultured Desulfuromusa sp. TaxID=219183 RepID=UPI002AA7DD61|nr:DUF6701 domain-containing protein [uncultured Desulfuromusa sp.]